MSDHSSPCNVLVAIAEGSEDIETVTIVDILRRADINVTLASVMDRRQVHCSRKTCITADRMLVDCIDEDWHMIVLPGGIPGSSLLNQSQHLKLLVEVQNQKKRWIAAICAAPAVALAEWGFIEHTTQMTCYPAFQSSLEEKGYAYSSDGVCVSRHIITSQGPATAMAFSLELVKHLTTASKAREIADGVLYKGFAELG